MNYAVIVAAGVSLRMRGIDKTFAQVCRRPAIYWTLQTFENHPQIGGIVLVGRSQDQQKLKELVQKKASEFKKVVSIVEGGPHRQDSVFNGLLEGQRLGWQEKDLVLIQDGARILVTEKEITPAILAAEKSGAAVVGVPVKDTIHQVDKEGFIAQTPTRENLFAAQTPQVLRFGLALSAFLKAQKEGRLFTDDVSLVRYYHPEIRVKVTPGSYENLKITTPKDLETVENILKEREK